MAVTVSPRSAARRFATAGAAAGLCMFATAALHPASADASASPSSAYLDAMNRERAAHGLPALVERPSLDAVADSWSAHMAATGVLAHNPRLTTSIGNWQSLGENVGSGGDVDSLDRAFWNSPEHRANILDPSFREVGVGAEYRDGVLWITVDFRDPMHAIARSDATAHPSVARGSVGAEHWIPLRTVRPSTRHRVLRVGLRGHDVARVQRRLRVSADGIFGPITRRAVLAFQRQRHYRATGVVGTRTWRAITR